MYYKQRTEQSSILDWVYTWAVVGVVTLAYGGILVGALGVGLLIIQMVV